MADAVSPAELQGRLVRLLSPGATGVVLAVSGGPDSMALLHLAARIGQCLPPLAVATVDHGLRAGSADDALRVQAAAEARGLPCRRLAWLGPKPATGIQARARQERYRLLAGYAEEIGADHVVTAHTADDQAETVLMRLLRGSGVAGLGAMQARTMRAGLAVVRPLLDLPKARLIATCQVAGLPVHHDPSNTDERFTRGRLRRLRPTLEAEGLNPAALVRLGQRLARADDALSRAAADARERSRGPLSDLALHWPTLRAEPVELVIRVLQRLVNDAGGQAPRLERLERLADRLLAAPAGTALRATLGGCLIELRADGALSARPEAARRRGRGTMSGAAHQPSRESRSWQG